MANFKRKTRKTKDATDSQGFSCSYIPASYDSLKYMNRQQQRQKAKEKEEIQNGIKDNGQERLPDSYQGCFYSRNNQAEFE